MDTIEVREVERRLATGDGGYGIVRERIDPTEGQAAFVPAGADHRFVGYEGLTVLVIFAGDRAATQTP